MPAMSALAEGVGRGLVVWNSLGLPRGLKRVVMVSGEHRTERVILKSVERVALPYRVRIRVFLILP